LPVFFRSQWQYIQAAWCVMHITGCPSRPCSYVSSTNVFVGRVMASALNSLARSSLATRKVLSNQNRSNSSHVTSHFPIQKLPTFALYRGPSFLSRPGSVSGLPTVTSPPGTYTISN
jgi:hypothetical protein